MSPFPLQGFKMQSAVNGASEIGLVRPRQVPEAETFAASNVHSRHKVMARQAKKQFGLINLHLMVIKPRHHTP